MSPILLSCIKILAAAVVFGLIGMIIGWLAAVMTREPPEEYKQCHGCMCGWCDIEPGGEECKEWRARNEDCSDKRG